MNSAKIQLSPEELLLVQNGEWILTKNVIIQKVYNLFGSLADEMKNKINKIQLPAEVLQPAPKISRGENYLGLPYAMLDYPRYFTRENVFAVRTFFWWAKYFSVTLHIKGDFKKMFADSIQKNISLLKENNFYINFAEDEWLHNIDAGDYALLDALDHVELKKYFLRSAFLKISAKVELQDWNKSESRLLNLYGVILKSLRD